MIGAGMGDEDTFKDTDRAIKKAVAEVAKAAEAQPQPDPSELWTDIINDPIEHAYPYPAGRTD
jgi:pyruvate dehydrogenase E1 component alpha subunit